MEGGAGFKLADYHDKDFELRFGVVSPATAENKVDWCRMKARVNKGSEELKLQNDDRRDGRLYDYSGKGGNDQWKFENDEGDDN